MKTIRRFIALKTTAIVAAAVGAATIVSCRNDIAQVDALTRDNRPPSTDIEAFSMVRTDSGQVVMRMRAARVVLEPSENDRTLVDRHASGGVEIVLYQGDGPDSVRARLTSHRAVEYAANGLSEALGDVVVVNDTNDTIRTERLVWDRRKHIFYTDQYTYIVRQGDVMTPRKGFEADENFRWYNLFNSQGDINIEDSLSRVDPPEAD